ncbi:SRPBCC family protein [Paenibacillus sp. DMB20]|uniref:SRPBCC family protein n=1 Tax=Paenibacillus sp. DMB20 TaxID=1642570 RepID=UPI0006277ABE|nr:SRPBCC domain-containing protein [Paenibacillus sp. DMB20]KKO51769.1 polyketide cyclase [Paenibacillus sp. DMB20]
MEPKETLQEVRQTIVVKAPIDKVWKAVSTSEGIAAWWMPNDLKPVLGQKFTLFTGQYGDSPCQVTELDPPYRLGFDWDEDWHVVFELKEMGEETEFTVIHSGWKTEKHSKIRGIMEQGWAQITVRLASYIED